MGTMKAKHWVFTFAAILVAFAIVVVFDQGLALLNEPSDAAVFAGFAAIAAIICGLGWIATAKVFPKLKGQPKDEEK